MQAQGYERIPLQPNYSLSIALRKMLYESYSQESKLKGLARSLQSLSLTAVMGNAFRTELRCLMGRLPGDSSEASLFELWLRPWCLPQLPLASCSP